MSQLPLPGLGNRVARYRKLNRWSAQRLADQTGGVVTRATLANLESGRRADLTLKQFLAVCLALRVPPSSLILDTERPFDPCQVEFPGDAPATVLPDSPIAALALWLDGKSGAVTPPSAGRVAYVNDLVETYLDDRDTLAARNARGRLLRREEADTDGSLRRIEARIRRTRQLLIEAGIEVPNDGND